MTAAIGAAMMASAIVVFAWAYGQYRRPDPARWTNSEGLTITVTLFMMSLLTFGLGMIVRALIQTDTLSMGLLEIATIAGAIAVAIVMVPMLTKPGRAAKVDETVIPMFVGSAAAMPAPANEAGPTMPSQPVGTGGTGGKVRRAA